MPFSCTLSGRTHPGRQRARNEDAFTLVDVPPLAVVADGMGGHPGGHVASALAVEAFRDHLTNGRASAGGPTDSTKEGSPSALGRRMLEAVDRAETRIGEAARENPAHQGMGTTLTALAVTGDGTYAVVHVGDSRAYRFAGGRLEQVTRDHTWVQEQVEQGSLPPHEARGHPWRHVLAQALGTADSRPQLVEGDARRGDVFLLCTDGLTTMLRDAEVKRILAETVDEGLEQAAEALVEAANGEGGLDNITVALLRVD